MTIESLRTFLMWNAIVNWAFLVAWLVMSIALRDFFFDAQTRLLGVERKTLEAYNYAGLMLYKILIIVFLAVPWIVSYFV